jgi:hypothetical protein
MDRFRIARRPGGTGTRGAGDEMIHQKRKILDAPWGLRGSTKRQRWEGAIRDKEESSIFQHGSNGDFDWPVLESKFGANPV